MKTEMIGLRPKSMATRMEGSVHFNPTKSPTQAPSVDIFNNRINFQALRQARSLTGKNSTEITKKPSQVKVKVQNNNTNRSMLCNKPERKTSMAAPRMQYPRMYVGPDALILLFIDFKHALAFKANDILIVGIELIGATVA